MRRSRPRAGVRLTTGRSARIATPRSACRIRSTLSAGAAAGEFPWAPSILCVPTRALYYAVNYGDLHAEDTPTINSRRAVSAGDLSARNQRDLAALGRRRAANWPSPSAQGDIQARDRMVRANLRLVVNIARGYTGKGLGLQDLIEEGNLGLLRAVEGFDPAMGTRFSTYASYWIKQSIKRALINTAKTIRIPGLHGRAVVEMAAGEQPADRRAGPHAHARGNRPRAGPAAQEAADHQEGHPHLQLHAADRSGRGRLVAGRDGHGRADSKAPTTRWSNATT